MVVLVQLLHAVCHVGLAVLEWALVSVIVSLARLLFLTRGCAIWRQDEILKQLYDVLLEVGHLSKRITKLEKVLLVLLFCFIEIFHVESSL